MSATVASAAEVRQFRAHPLLARLSDETFAALLAAARPLRALRGHSLFAVGAGADEDLHRARTHQVERVGDVIVRASRPGPMQIVGGTDSGYL